MRLELSVLFLSPLLCLVIYTYSFNPSPPQLISCTQPDILDIWQRLKDKEPLSPNRAVLHSPRECEHMRARAVCIVSKCVIVWSFFFLQPLSIISAILSNCRDTDKYFKYFTMKTYIAFFVLRFSYCCVLLSAAVTVEYKNTVQF